MKITSWNCRGLGNPKKAEDMKYLMRMESTRILLLQETKIDKDVLYILRKTNQKMNTGIYVSARSTYGGLATIWLKEKFTLLSSFVS